MPMLYFAFAARGASSQSLKMKCPGALLAFLDDAPFREKAYKASSMPRLPRPLHFKRGVNDLSARRTARSRASGAACDAIHELISADAE